MLTAQKTPPHKKTPPHPHNPASVAAAPPHPHSTAADWLIAVGVVVLGRVLQYNTRRRRQQRQQQQRAVIRPTTTVVHPTTTALPTTTTTTTTTTTAAAAACITAAQDNKQPHIAKGHVKAHVSSPQSPTIPAVWSDVCDDTPDDIKHTRMTATETQHTSDNIHTIVPLASTTANLTTPQYVWPALSSQQHTLERGLAQQHTLERGLQVAQQVGVYVDSVLQGMQQQGQQAGVGMTEKQTGVDMTDEQVLVLTQVWTVRCLCSVWRCWCIWCALGIVCVDVLYIYEHVCLCIECCAILRAIAPHTPHAHPSTPHTHPVARVHM